MSTSAPKKKKKKKKKERNRREDQPSSSKTSSMFDKFDRPRSTAHKKAAAVPGEVEDQPPLPLRRATRSTTQSSAQPATSEPSSDGIPSYSYKAVVKSSPDCPYKVYKIEGKEEQHQRGNE